MEEDDRAVNALAQICLIIDLGGYAEMHPVVKDIFEIADEALDGVW